MQENQPTTYDHQSNGQAEIVVKLFTRKILTLKLCLVNILTRKFTAEYSLVHWLAAYVVGVHWTTPQHP